MSLAKDDGVFIIIRNHVGCRLGTIEEYAANQHNFTSWVFGLCAAAQDRARIIKRRGYKPPVEVVGSKAGLVPTLGGVDKYAQLQAPKDEEDKEHKE